MASQRPPSGIGRPLSRSGSVVPGPGRPPTAIRPPPTAIRVATGMVPGTSGHPGMRGGIPMATPGVLSAQIKVTDRPVTQQGLSGMKTGVKGPQRQILDKSYYLGLLRSKINELTTETSKLLKEIDNFNQENSVYLSYERRAEGLALEIKDLQGQLADYNMVNVCEVGRSQPVSLILFSKEAIRAMEEEIRRERRVADEVVQAMPAAKQEKYFTMTTANEELLQVLMWAPLTAELAHSHIKQEVVRLHETLSALEAKRDAMEAEHKSRGSPQDEREQLFKQVTKLFCFCVLRLTEIRDRMGQITEDIRQLEQDSEDAQGNGVFLIHAFKSTSVIPWYLQSFEESRAHEQDRMTQSQEDIVSLLEHCSRNMLRLRTCKKVLVSKETEVVQSKSTAKGLTTESQRLQLDLEKVQQLEGKITGELSTLKERVTAMEAELVTYRDLDALRHTAEQKKRRLQEDRVLLTRRRDSLRQLLEEKNQKYEALKAALQENETHAQLTNLERKWQHLEQNNFVMKEFIASKSQESDFASVAKNVSQQVAEYNKSLIDVLQNNRS
uniref:Intraflagellar transport 74 homolog n=1 Tax=Gasterosteus aculeatus aculeatus TaxID=481459 RepID=G3N7I2_GASAC